MEQSPSLEARIPQQLTEPEHLMQPVLFFLLCLSRTATREQTLPLPPALSMLHAHALLVRENTRDRKIKWPYRASRVDRSRGVKWPGVAWKEVHRLEIAIIVRSDGQEIPRLLWSSNVHKSSYSPRLCVVFQHDGFKRRELSPRQTPSWRTTCCRLSATVLFDISAATLRWRCFPW